MPDNWPRCAGYNVHYLSIAVSTSVTVDPLIQTVTEGDTFTTCFDLTLPDTPPDQDIVVDVVVTEPGKRCHMMLISCEVQV